MSHSVSWQGSCLFAYLVMSCLTLPAWADSLQDTMRAEAVKYREDGVRLQQQGNFQEALGALQKATFLDAGYAAPHNDLGILYETLGQREAAEREYLTTLQIDPGYLKAHTNLAMLYETLGQRDRAAFHWLQRYRKGVPDDLWTQKAKERLVALGYLDAKTDDLMQELQTLETELTSEAASASAVAPTGDERRALTPSATMTAQPPAPERALNNQLTHYDTMLREFEAITDPGKTTFGKRPYTTTNEPSR